MDELLSEITVAVHTADANLESVRKHIFAMPASDFDKLSQIESTHFIEHSFDRLCALVLNCSKNRAQAKTKLNELLQFRAKKIEARQRQEEADTLQQRCNDDADEEQEIYNRRLQEDADRKRFIADRQAKRTANDMEAKDRYSEEQKVEKLRRSSPHKREKHA
jgi:hypothetical protein